VINKLCCSRKVGSNSYFFCTFFCNDDKGTLMGHHASIIESVINSFYIVHEVKFDNIY